MALGVFTSYLVLWTYMRAWSMPMWSQRKKEKGPYVSFQKWGVEGPDGSVWQNNDWFLQISEASTHPRPSQSQKTKAWDYHFLRGSVFIKSVALRVQTAPFDKITIDFCRSRRRLHDSDLILNKNPNIWPKIPKIPKKSRKIPKNQWIPRNS